MKKYIIILFFILTLCGCEQININKPEVGSTNINIHVSDDKGNNFSAIPIEVVQKNSTGGKIVGHHSTNDQGILALGVTHYNLPGVKEWYEFHINVAGFEPQTRIVYPTGKDVNLDVILLKE